MRRIAPGSPSPQPWSVDRAAVVTRDGQTLTGVISLPGGRTTDGCLSCRPAPCITFVEHSPPEDVCPVAAIEMAPIEGHPAFADSCLGCGLCAIRCPVGAIEWSGSAVAGRGVIKPGADVLAGPMSTIDLEQLALGTQWHRDDIDALADRLASATAALGQDAFYPLTEKLFRAAGFDARLGRPGDTANRIDLTLVSDNDAVPVEIKSPTESRAVNMKSIQQALENKVILMARQPFESRRESASLVVALDLPAARSAVTELVDDIWTAYRIRIGLLALSDLWRAAIAASRGTPLWTWDALAAARGPLAAH
jgi:Fe-S-cluster-containing hydrogenase component 2